MIICKWPVDQSLLVIVCCLPLLIIVYCCLLLSFAVARFCFSCVVCYCLLLLNVCYCMSFVVFYCLSLIVVCHLSLFVIAFRLLFVTCLLSFVAVRHFLLFGFSNFRKLLVQPKFHSCCMRTLKFKPSTISPISLSSYQY